MIFMNRNTCDCYRPWPTVRAFDRFGPHNAPKEPELKIRIPLKQPRNKK